MFVKEPALFGHDGIIPITLGGYHFFESNPAILFYVLETSTLIIIHRKNESQLLSLLSRKELLDLSIHSVNYWRYAGGNQKLKGK
jgi:hypothetical protein